MRVLGVKNGLPYARFVALDHSFKDPPPAHPPLPIPLREGKTKTCYRCCTALPQKPCLPRPLQSLGHSMRWQASPVNPDRHEQSPVYRSHTPMLEHSVRAACAVLSAVA